MHDDPVRRRDDLASCARIAASAASPLSLTSRRTVPSSQRYRQLVECFEEIARATLGHAKSMPEICAAVGVGPRTLVRAVRAVRGTTPSRHLHALALAETRRALLDGSTASVREAALRFGFRELGRFAADYRAAFGENPSETLRRHSRQANDGEPGFYSNS
jgi:transcriptional regulator GlxA family with amidase domain